MDESDAAALIEQLTEKLSGLDDETIEAITQKWGAHEDLAGKIRAQIVQILFNDCKTIVRNKETRHAIWEKR